MDKKQAFLDGYQEKRNYSEIVKEAGDKKVEALDVGTRKKLVSTTSSTKKENKDAEKTMGLDKKACIEKLKKTK